MLRFPLVVALLSLCSSLLTGCLEYKIHEVKDFRIFVDTDQPKLQYAIEVLALQYNRDVGAHALTIVHDRAESNSTITFVEGMNNSEGHKLGLAQWVTNQSEKNSMASQGPRKSVTIDYGMEVEFDRENFLSRADFVNDPRTNEFQHLYHLFCHEIGHGMQLDHNSDINNVMYKSIPDTTTRVIDYDGYFRSIRAFLNIKDAPDASVAKN